jgi:hypothetical protein
MSNQRGRLRVYSLWALMHARCRATVIAEHPLQAYPVLVQFDGRLTRSAPGSLWSNIGISHAVSRCNLWETARASFCAGWRCGVFMLRKKCTSRGQVAAPDMAEPRYAADCLQRPHRARLTPSVRRPKPTLCR